jgi:hypothetical protein
LGNLLAVLQLSGHSQNKKLLQAMLAFHNLNKMLSLGRLVHHFSFDLQLDFHSWVDAR